MSTSDSHGPLGRPRGIGFGILLFIVTFGFYGWHWAFKTQEEMKQHRGDGLGGVLGLVVWILIAAVSAFVIPSEVGRMYAKDGRQPPISGWTGLWLFPGVILIIPAIVWFVKVQRALNRYWAGKAHLPQPPKHGTRFVRLAADAGLRLDRTGGYKKGTCAPAPSGTRVHSEGCETA